MDWTNDFMSLPYLDRGRDRKGVDCWGLFRLIYKEKLGINLPDYLASYKDSSDYESLGPLIHRERLLWKAISPGEEKEFDAIVLRMMGVPMHVGCVLPRGNMLHIHEHINAVVERYDNNPWMHRVIGFYRYINE